MIQRTVILSICQQREGRDCLGLCSAHVHDARVFPSCLPVVDVMPHSPVLSFPSAPAYCSRIFCWADSLPYSHTWGTAFCGVGWELQFSVFTVPCSAFTVPVVDRSMGHFHAIILVSSFLPLIHSTKPCGLQIFWCLLSLADSRGKRTRWVLLLSYPLQLEVTTITSTHIPSTRTTQNKGLVKPCFVVYS